MKFANWNGESLSGHVTIFLKIDGVHACKNENGEVVSRHGKPLYNIPDFDGRVEIFLGTFKETIQAVRTKSYMAVSDEHVYTLYPNVDHRLHLGVWPDGITKHEVLKLLADVNSQGHEGLILKVKDEDVLIKVKPKITIDSEVTGWVEGTGKYTNKMGAIITAYGKIGTGFTDKEREMFTKDYIIGKIVEFEGMEILPSGKMRHPRFIRLRDDK